MNNYSKYNKGITLIALVVTIIIMIILAGVSINLILGQYGIIQRTKDSKEMQIQAEILQQLELQKGAISIDGKGYTDLNKYTEYISKNQLNGHTVTKIEKLNDATVILTIDGKYLYTAAQIENDVVINQIGNIDIMSPEILSFEVLETSTHSINVQVVAKVAEKYEFYIKKSSESEYVLDGELSGENADTYKEETKTYVYENKEQNETYDIKVVIKNGDRKISEEELGIKLGEIPTPEITVEDANTWTNENKSVTISTTKGYTTKYTLDGTIPSETNGTQYTEAFTIDENCTITAVYLDSSNQISTHSTNEITKIDKAIPSAATINTNGYTAGKYTTAATVTLTASATDDYGEIDRYEFSIDGGKTVASTTNPYSISDNYCSKTVYARAVDKAGNVGAWSTAVAVKKGKTLASVASAGQYVKYNGANWRIYSKSGTYVYLVGVANSSYTLSGKSNYDNVVTLLNNQAKTKLNTTYATAARSINANDNITTLTNYGFNGSWLATQTGALTGNPLMTYYGVYFINSGTKGYENLACYVHSSAAWISESYSKKVGAIITLKSNIITSGTSSSVWQLVAPGT